MVSRATLEIGASDMVGEKTAQDIPQGPSQIAPIREQPAYAIAIGQHDNDPSPTHSIRSFFSIEAP